VKAASLASRRLPFSSRRSHRSTNRPPEKFSRESSWTSGFPIRSRSSIVFSIMVPPGGSWFCTTSRIRDVSGASWTTATVIDSPMANTPLGFGRISTPPRR
jgi:hypothetical protein